MFSGLKIAVVFIVLAAAGGGLFYVKQLQSNLKIAQLNNAKLTTAVETSEKSIALLKEDNARLNKLSDQLSKDLQKAEQYGDNLRNRLRELDLVQDAIRDSKNLEGRRNGATAKLWRELEAATGGNGDSPLPNWLLDVPRTGDKSSNRDREDNSTIVARPKPIDLVDTRVYVVTAENYESFVEEFTAEHGELAYVVLSMKDYENLAINIADLRRYLEQQTEIIVYYENAVKADTPDNTTKK